jgi:hypothetical protein
MSIQDAVETLNACTSAPLYARIKDGCIIGEFNENPNEHILDRPAVSVFERFVLQPSGRIQGLWFGTATRYRPKHEWQFAEKPLDAMVCDIIDFYDESAAFAYRPDLMMTIIMRLTEQGFFVQNDGTIILGSLRMNFGTADFWVSRFGTFYFASDPQLVRGVIGCSRSYDILIESLMAYYVLSDKTPRR